MRQIPVLLAAALLSTEPGFAQTTQLPSANHFAEGTTSFASTGYLPPVAPVNGPAAPTVPQGPREDLVTFDPNTTEVICLDRRWQLVSGGVWLKDCGLREGDARAALRVIRDLHLNQHGTIGSPQPIMEYWLTDGHAPQGFSTSARLLPLDLNSLRVEQVQGQWCLRDARRLFFVFGTHQQDASQALDIIRHHGFTQVGYLGQPVPAMIYFLGGPDSLAHARPAPPVSLAAHTIPDPSQPDGAGPTAGLGPNQQEGTPVKAPATLPNVRQLAANQPAIGDRVCFDCRQLQVRHDSDGWKLVFGNYTIAEFGPCEYEARRALDVLHFYRCNEHCLIGQPRPVFSFFLANGQPPRGLMFGLGGQPFHIDTLTVHQVGAQWAVCEGEHMLIACGDRVEEARKLLEIIQQQKLDTLCRVGHDERHCMSLLVRAH